MKGEIDLRFREINYVSCVLTMIMPLADILLQKEKLTKLLYVYIVPCFMQNTNFPHAVCTRLFVTPRTVARQTPLPIGFSRKEYWSGLPFPFPGDLPDPGIEPRSPSPALQVNSLSLSHQASPQWQCRRDVNVHFTWKKKEDRVQIIPNDFPGSYLEYSAV